MTDEINNPEVADLLLQQESTSSDEEEFIFTDQAHQQQEFERFSASLANIGLLEKDLVDDVVKDTHESQLKQQRQQQQSRRASKLVAYHEGVDETFVKVMQEVERIQQHEASKGMSNHNFTFGLLNCLLIAYVFGAHPEHFWILYIVETLTWVSWKFRKSLQADPCEILYYLDYCWVMNFSGVLLLLTFIVLGNERVDAHATILPTEIRKQLFLSAFGTFCGPVFLASMALPFVAFLFHDVNTMANLIIHLMPSMAMYTLRWNAKVLHDTYPTFFNLQYLHDTEAEELYYWNGFGNPSVARNGLAVYFCWWIPYTLWMLLGGGLQIPRTSKADNPTPSTKRRKYDTVFHSLWRGGPCELVGKLLWNRPKKISQEQSQRNDFEVRDLLVYMVGHAVACVSLGVGVVAGTSYLGGQRGHSLMLIFSTVLCAERGAQRYSYYVTAMYGQKLQKAYKKAQRNTQSRNKSSKGKKSN
ncbi:MAG: hypothetical protein SGILL_009030 [Bacillariaceae sp.]